ncbi:MAG: YihY/virulence factor BrkB family protein [Saprospiraceae bacterium]
MLKKLQQKIIEHPAVNAVLDWSKERSFPGFFGVPIYDVTVFILHEIKQHALITRANSMAFSFFLSLFPFILSLLTLLPYMQRYIFKYIVVKNQEILDMQNTGALLEQLKMQFEEFIPVGVFNTIADVAMNPRPGLLSVGFIFATFFASNGMMSMMRGFEKSYQSTFRKRSGWRKRMVAINLTLLIAGLVLISVLLVVLGQILMNVVLDYFAIDSFGGFLLQALRWLVVIALFYFGIALIYRYGCSTIRRFSLFSPGATLATILSILTSLIFSFYVKEFDTYNQLYGYIGTIIVIMLWIQLNAFILLVGFELNASIAVNRDLKILGNQSKKEEA